MAKLLAECVMWDTSLAIFFPPVLPAPRAAAAAAAAAATDKTLRASSSTLLPSQEDHHLTLCTRHEAVKIYHAVHPEVILMSTKTLFASYQSPFNSLLNKVSGHLLHVATAHVYGAPVTVRRGLCGVLSSHAPKIWRPGNLAVSHLQISRPTDLDLMTFDSNQQCYCITLLQSC
jgi:hypothetical protein